MLPQTDIVREQGIAVLSTSGPDCSADDDDVYVHAEPNHLPCNINFAISRLNPTHSLAYKLCVLVFPDLRTYNPGSKRKTLGTRVRIISWEHGKNGKF